MASSKRAKFNPINNTTIDLYFKKATELWKCFICQGIQTSPLIDGRCETCHHNRIMYCNSKDDRNLHEVIRRNYVRFMLLNQEPESPSKARFIKMATRMLNAKTANFRCFLHVLHGTNNKVCLMCNHISVYRTLLVEYKSEVSMPFYYGKKQFIDSILDTMSKYVKKIQEIKYIEF